MKGSNRHRRASFMQTFPIKHSTAAKYALWNVHRLRAQRVSVKAASLGAGSNNEGGCDVALNSCSRTFILKNRCKWKMNTGTDHLCKKTRMGTVTKTNTATSDVLQQIFWLGADTRRWQHHNTSRGKYIRTGKAQGTEKAHCMSG